MDSTVSIPNIGIPDQLLYEGEVVGDGAEELAREATEPEEINRRCSGGYNAHEQRASRSIYV